jgi:hypothetical protein
VLASLRRRVLGGSSVVTQDGTEGGEPYEPYESNSDPHNAVGNTREATTALVVASVSRARERWASLKPSPEEFDKVPCGVLSTVNDWSNISTLRLPNTGCHRSGTRRRRGGIDGSALPRIRHQGD